MAESEEKLKNLLMKVKEERKCWFKTQHSKNQDHGIPYHHFMANRWGNNENSERLHFLGLQNHCRWWLQLWNWKTLAPWKKSYDQPRQYIKKQRHYFADKGPFSQSYGFSSSCVWMWGLDHKAECRRIDAFELWCWRRLLSPLDSTEIKPVNPKGNQSWIFTGRTDAEAESPILWPPDGKSWLIGKDPDAGKDWRWRRRGRQRMRRLDGITDLMDRVWVNSGSWGWTGRPGMLQSMGLQRVGHDWATELNWLRCRG